MNTNKTIKKDRKGLFICPFCQECFKSLVYHTRQKHNIDKIKLRVMFSLPLNYPLEIKAVRENRKDKAIFYNMGENLKVWGSGSRFKKGFKHNLIMKQKISRGHLIKNRNKLINNEVLD